MEYGVALPNFAAGASPEGIEAVAQTAARLGWHSVWVTDHVAVDRGSAREYGHIFEALTTLAWVGPAIPELRLGTSVIVVPQRNAVVLAKEFATLDVLSGGRVIAGVGIGWNKAEFANLGVGELFRKRGAYLDETIRLWRHLWSGSELPFLGRFHRLEDFVFSPLPVRRDALPIWVGGPSEAALRRAGTLGEGYQSSRAGPEQYAERIPVIRAAAGAAGRPMPELSARVPVRFDRSRGPGYVLAGSPGELRAGVEAFGRLGVTLLVLAFGETDPERAVGAMERFQDEV